MAKMKTSTSAGSKQRSAKDASFAPVSNAETTNNSKCSSSVPSATKGIVYVFNEAKAGGESVKETGTGPAVHDDKPQDRATRARAVKAAKLQHRKEMVFEFKKLNPEYRQIFKK